MNRSLAFAAVLIAILVLPGSLLGATALYEQQGRDALREGDAADASLAYETAAGLSPWRGDLWEAAAAAALMARTPERAVELIGHAGTPSLEASIILGAALLELDELGAALAAYEAALQQYGAHPRLYAGIAGAHRAQGDRGAEQRALEYLLGVEPGNAGAQYRLGLLILISDPEAAMRNIERAAALDEAFASAAETLKAAAALASREDSDAARLISYGRGLALVDEWVLSGDAFGRAVEEDPQNGEAWAWLGEARWHSGSDGKRELDRSLVLSPDSPVVRGLRGLYLERAARYDEAIAEYGEASQLAPRDSAWQISLGRAHAAAGDLPAALEAYQRATELEPTQAEAWLELARFCAANGVYMEEIGLPAALRASELKADDVMVQDVLGWVYLLTGRPVLAQGILEAAVAAEPGYLAARLHLALAYAAQGRASEGRPHLEFILQAGETSSLAAEAARLLAEISP